MEDDAEEIKRIFAAELADLDDSYDSDGEEDQSLRQLEEMRTQLRQSIEDQNGDDDDDLQELIQSTKAESSRLKFIEEGNITKAPAHAASPNPKKSSPKNSPKNKTKSEKDNSRSKSRSRSPNNRSPKSPRSRDSSSPKARVSPGGGSPGAKGVKFAAVDDGETAINDEKDNDEIAIKDEEAIKDEKDNKGTATKDTEDLKKSSEESEDEQHTQHTQTIIHDLMDSMLTAVGMAARLTAPRAVEEVQEVRADLSSLPQMLTDEDEDADGGDGGADMEISGYVSNTAQKYDELQERARVQEALKMMEEAEQRLQVGVSLDTERLITMPCSCSIIYPIITTTYSLY